MGVDKSRSSLPGPELLGRESILGKGVRNSDFFGNVFEKVTPPNTSNTWFTNKLPVVSVPAIISPLVFADQMIEEI